MNVDGEMQFGELEETQPRRQLRPDANRHYATRWCGAAPVAGELPVFIDLDVLLELEQHAASDTQVELGGVLLGCQCLDPEGHPFVLVTDSLRAEHYQATKGSFKFTHETWESITRRRDEFPPETELVGWYHTHPDWGVFLSGMDLFICENFFARPLDVAIVIDPCRGDRGVFVWDRDAPGQVRRTAGYFLTTSRFRQQELVGYARFFEEGVMRSLGTSTMSAPAAAPIIQVAEPRSPWLLSVVCGMLTIQLLAILLLAWQLAAPRRSSDSAAELARVAELLEQQSAQSNRDLASTAKLEVLDRLLAQQENLPGNVATQLAEQSEELSQLRAALQGLDAAQRDARQQLAEREQELKQVRSTAATREDRLQRELDDSLAKLDTLRERYRTLAAQLGDEEALAADDESLTTSPTRLAARHPVLISLGAVAIIALGTIVSLVVLRRRAAEADWQQERRP